MAKSDLSVSSKKVLVIAYAFPPEIGGGAVMRTVKFIKWLRNLGWEPIVLTVKRHDTLMPDPDLLKEIDGVVIHRCGDYFRGLIRSVLLKLFKENSSGGKISHHLWRHSESGGFHTINIIKKFLYDIICVPDECLGWIVPAAIKGRKIIQKEEISMIFSTCPPFSNHMVGYILKKICGSFLIIDYRDRWLGNKLFDGYTFWRRKINQWLEYLVVKECDHIITTTENQAKHFRNDYRTDRVKVVWNGYDEEDFDFKIPEKEKKDKMVLCHIGKLSTGRALKSILAALESLNEEILRDIELNLIGILSEENEICIKKSKVALYINTLGFYSHHEVLKMMFECDVLMLLQSLESDGYNAIPAKIFEYIRASKPALAICPRNSEIWNLVSTYNIGICADTSDSEKIKEAIIFMHKKWGDGTLPIHSSAKLLEKCNRKKQTEQLINIFEEVRSIK